MLDCLELNIEILDADMKTIKSNDYRRLSKDDRNANSMLAII